MKKKYIIAKIQEYLKNELSKAKQAHQTTKDYSQSSDLKQEGKYDTRAIEAGYLAGAQLKRVEEIKRDLSILNRVEENVLQRNDRINAYSLVKVLNEDETELFYFLCPTLAPSTIQIENTNIHIASLGSPLGQGMINLREGDDFSFEIAGEEKEFTILQIF